MHHACRANGQWQGLCSGPLKAPGPAAAASKPPDSEVDAMEQAVPPGMQHHPLLAGEDMEAQQHVEAQTLSMREEQAERFHDIPAASRASSARSRHTPSFGSLAWTGKPRRRFSPREPQSSGPPAVGSGRRPAGGCLD